jgi:hypothetical protein
MPSRTVFPLTSFENRVLTGEFHPWKSGCEILSYMAAPRKIPRHFKEDVRTMLDPRISQAYVVLTRTITRHRTDR